jgi:hypothetical protein
MTLFDMDINIWVSPKFYQVVVLAVIAFVFEHTARLHGWWRFSIALQWIADWSYELFLKLGRLVSHLSAFLNYIDMEEVIKTVQSLLLPLWEIFISPGAFLYGYAKVAWTEVIVYSHT